MNEEYLYEIGQEVWVAFPSTRTVRVGKILECIISIDDTTRTVKYTLQGSGKTFTAIEVEVFLDAASALDALLQEIGAV